MNMSIKLYEMAQYYTDALESIESAENIESVFETLDAIDVSVKEKVESIGDMIRGYEAEEAALKEEMKRLNERAASAAKEKDKLLKYIEYVMNTNKFEELKGLKHTFNFTVSGSLKCIDASLVPKQFRKIAVSADIAAMKEHLKQAYDDQGIKLVNKPSKKPKGKEMLFTELNDDIRDMGLEFTISKTLKMK